VHHRIYRDDENNIIRMEVVGKFDVADAEESVKLLDGLLSDCRGDHLLADLSGSPNLTVDRETRRLLQVQGKELVFDKMAVLGASPVTRMIAKVVMSVLGRASTVSFFSAEKDALAWFTDEAGTRNAPVLKVKKGE